MQQAGRDAGESSRMTTRRARHRRRSPLAAAARRCRSRARVRADGLPDPARSASSCRSRRAAAPTSCRGWCSRTCRACSARRSSSRTAPARRAGSAPAWWRSPTPTGTRCWSRPKSSLVIAPHIGQSIGYDPLKDFAPVSLLTRNTVMLVVHPSVPAQHVAGVHGAGARQARRSCSTPRPASAARTISPARSSTA